MTLLELITNAGAAAANLRQVLVEAGNKLPDLKPAADEWIAALDGGVTAENLAAVASALPAEIINIAHGKLNPTEHPADGI